MVPTPVWMTLTRHIFVVQFFQRRYDCADGALYVALDDEIEVLDFALLNLAEKLFERGARVSGEDLFSEASVFLFSAISFAILSCLTALNSSPASGTSDKSENLDRGGRSCLFDGILALVSLVIRRILPEQVPATTRHAALERSVGDQQGRDRTLCSCRDSLR